MSGGRAQQQAAAQVFSETDDLSLLRLVRDESATEDERGAACGELVRRYEPIVRACVQRYRDSPESAEDLMQVGYVGLMKAINNFDPELGDNLAAYARPCVSGEIKRYFRDKRWQIRVHRSAQEMRLRIRDVTADLTQQLGRMPTGADLAQQLQVSEAEIAETQLASQAFQVAYLDAPLVSDDDARGSMADFIGAEDSDLDQVVDMDSVWRHFEELPEREQLLLMLRFYGNMTQSQIGDELGISQMHVSRLLAHALSYLRDHLNDEPDS
jgi:RNA polymerase sigma-B factor